jgi:hypothetical protein
MMKKYIFFILVIALAMPNAFAVDFSLSAGAGGLAGYTFTRYSLESGKDIQTQSMDRFNFGGFVFFDATYAELAITIQGGHSSWTESMRGPSVATTNNKGTGNETNLGFSINGKYPFSINDTIKWFPLVGIEYQIALMQQRKHEGGNYFDRTRGIFPEDQDINGNSYPLHAWNSFWINAGAGLDYSISERF